MYPKVIFPKNNEKTTRQLEFKFYPLPAESAEFCLFRKTCMKTFREEGVWLFVHKMWSNSFKKYSGHILKHSFGMSFTKNPIFGTPRKKNSIFIQRKRKLWLATLSAIPTRTLPRNMRSFEETMHRNRP